MSSQFASVRIRSQRSAAAAVERARLTVVAARPSSAPRAPFAVLVFLILGAGVVGLLMFNTQMQQASIYATQLEAKADALEAKSQALTRELEGRRDPQQVAEAARKLGMVAPENPAMVSLKDGRILGIPVPATPDDAIRVKPPRAAPPAWANRKPIVKKVVAQPQASTPRNATGTGAASPKSGTAAGTNKTQNKPAQGAPR